MLTSFSHHLHCHQVFRNRPLIGFNFHDERIWNWICYYHWIFSIHFLRFTLHLLLLLLSVLFLLNGTRTMLSTILRFNSLRLFIRIRSCGSTLERSFFVVIRIQKNWKAKNIWIFLLLRCRRWRRLFLLFSLFIRQLKNPMWNYFSILHLFECSEWKSFGFTRREKEEFSSEKLLT